MHHRETFSQAAQATPDATMTANDASQTDNATYANAGTGSDDLPKPPPGGGRIQVDGIAQTSGLPPPEHYVHLHSHGGGPPPPAPDQARNRISTSDRGTSATPPQEAASSSGNPPPQPPGYGAAVRKNKIANPYEKVAAGNPTYCNISDHPTPGRTALAHEQDTEMAQQQTWQDKEDKRAQNKASMRQNLMETDNAPVQVKRAADAASRSVAQHMLDLNTQAAKARRQRELQIRDDEKAIREAMKQAATVERQFILEAKRAKSASEREQKAAAKREKSTAKAEADAQNKTS